MNSARGYLPFSLKEVTEMPKCSICHLNHEKPANADAYWEPEETHGLDDLLEELGLDNG